VNILLQILFRGIAIYFITLVVIRVMGKREIGQLSIFDFAIILVIADILVSGLEDLESPFYYYILPIVALAIIQKIIAFLMLKIPMLREAFEGKDSLIIDDGKLDLKEMKKQNYNVDDLLTQLRLKNIRSLSELKYVILETNGEISVFKHSDFENNEESKKDEKDQSNTDSQNVSLVKGSGGSESTVSSSNEIYPFPLIVSGKVKRDNLDTLSLTEKWLEKQAKKKGKTIKDIMYGNYENGKLFIMPTKNS